MGIIPKGRSCTIITVRLAIGICQVLDLDNGDTAERLGVEIVSTTRRHVLVRGTKEGLRKLQAACQRRRSMVAFDQPLAWARSAKAAEDRIAIHLRHLETRRGWVSSGSGGKDG
jgi:hypothetical protein